MSAHLEEENSDKELYYPYLPEGRSIEYVSEENEFMARAIELVVKMEKEHPEANRVTAGVLVRDGEILAEAQNNPIHKTFCPRVALNSPSGQEYDLCPDYCHSKNHSERSVIKEAREKGLSSKDADIYLAGHWWACKSCWDAIIEGGVKNLFLVEGAHDIYDEKERRSSGAIAGLIKKDLSVCIKGSEAEKFSEYLSRVKIKTVPEQEADVVILLSGSSDEDLNNKTTYDYRDISDIKQAITKFSQDLEEFERFK